MKALATIPIKTNSTRVKGKNFRPLGGKKLYEYIIEHALESGCFDDLVVDTDSQEIVEYCGNKGVLTIPRDPWLASNDANGNDLLVHHFNKFQGYDAYFQLYATAPFLKPETIRACYERLATSGAHDSVLTATQEGGWFWCQGLPVNYQPGLLPRSQDAIHVVKETTGLYGVRSDVVSRYHCRIGSRPIFVFVEPKEAIDLDTEQDFKLAERMIEQ